MVGPPPGWDLERQREYFDWAKAVVDQLPRANAKLLALFEEAYQAKP
jgi:guanosine-3',5'-bis(diphosphate) 3'-pyrophosphohydrolase